MEQEAPGWQFIKPMFLADLGRIEVALERYQDAEGCFLQSLRLAWSRRWQAHMLSALAGLAELRAKQGQLERALELSSLVIHHRVSKHAHREKAEQLVAELQSQLPSDVVTQALERGQSMCLEEVVERILNQSP